MGAMTVLARTIGQAIEKSVQRTLSPPMVPGGVGRDGWQRILEPFGGAWQRNIECRPENALAYSAVFACSSLISADIAKLPFRLERETADGIYVEASSPSFSPVLAKPNHYQTHIQFKECWENSLSRTGNTYILKQRNDRNNVVALFVLDPLRVQPMVAFDGSIFYQLQPDNMSELESAVLVPASEIIHDRINCFFHPLVGISPLFAAALSAGVGLEIERNSARFFANGAKISGILTVPGALTDENAKKLSDNFNKGYTAENAGKVAVLADGLKFTQLTMSSNDAQMIDVLKKTAEDVCAVFHVPPFMAGFGPAPPYNNIEALTQQYYQQALQYRIENMEVLMAEGLALPDHYSICLDLSGLLRMDTATRYTTIGKAVSDGVLTPNEARSEFNLKPLVGGDTVYLQQQDFALSDLAKRSELPNPFVIDKPASNPTPSTTGPAATADPTEEPAKQLSDDVVLKDFDLAMTLVVAQIAPLQTQAA